MNNLPLQLPLHPRKNKSSDMEYLVGGIVRTDYKRAHAAAGDQDYKIFLKESCQRCYHQAVEAEEAGYDPPTTPDQEWVDDDLE